ncbi:U-box domain-containing protein 5 [Canna indica]|uniref:RING-type E3 ubiquitin transferase n=1 Tax=Canna indica TaxID=4628 RepID=A0AAQ3QCW8_9LILI|nr:U-box domain-containing protein 5 [Canna indica]
MGSDVAGVVKATQNNCDVKVNYSIYSELSKILETINFLLPAIESARPGCTSGMLELCSLNNAVEKAKQILQQCAESSKLYLAITGEATLSRCERIRSSLIQSLCQIQNMVPPSLASKIAEVLEYLRVAKFKVDSSEEEAGRALLDLLQRTDYSEELEFEAFQIATSRLKLTSPKDILMERRSLNKLLDKLNGSDTKKEKILNYFIYLLKKHGKNVKQDGHEHKENGKTGGTEFTRNMNSSSNRSIYSNNDEPSGPREGSIDVHQAFVPPVELCCPISSRLMCDPVVISSGQTYERTNIEKWFEEGHDTCPKTQRKLANLSMIPNSCMKDLISTWCMNRGINVPESHNGHNSAKFSSWEPSHIYSISSLNNVSAALLDGRTGFFLQSDHSNVSFISSDASYCSDSSHVNGIKGAKDNHSHVFSWIGDHQQCQSFSDFNHDFFHRSFSMLLELPNDVQGKALENVKILLESDEEISHAILSDGFTEALISFMKSAREMSNIQAMKTGSRLFLAILSKNRIEISSSSIEDALQLFISFLDSEISTEALMLLKKLIQDPSCRSNIMTSDAVSSIIKILDSEDVDSVELSLKVLLDLSPDRDLKSYILSSRSLTKLASFLTDEKLSHLSLKIIQNISDDEEGALLVAKNNACLASIVELLDTGSKEEQELAVDILYSICSRSYENCLFVMDEGVIPALVEISVNGNAKGKDISLRLLHLLRDVRCSHRFVNSYINPEPIPELTENIIDHPGNKPPHSKPVGFFRRKLRFFSKARSSTPC